MRFIKKKTAEEIELDEKAELERMETLLSEMILNRKEKHESTVKDFGYCAHKTDTVMIELGNARKAIKGQQTKVDNLKRELGWSEREVILSLSLIHI